VAVRARFATPGFWAALVPLGLTGWLVGGIATSAWAYDVALELRTVGQGYQERRFDARGGNEILSRRRLTQFLTLNVDGLEPASWTTRQESGRLGASVVLRFDTDFGRYASGAPQGRDAIGELDQQQVDVLEAALRGQGLGHRLGFELGRQLHLDALDFYAFDGLRLDLRLWRSLAVEVVGGTEVRGERPVSAPIFEADGTSAGDHDPASQRAQNSVLRPTVGAALLWRSWTSPFGARVAYRRSWSATAEGAKPPLGLGDGAMPSRAINAEHFIATADYTGRFVSAEAGARYNLLTAGWDRHEISLRLKGPGRQTLVLEEMYLMPSFDGDSIWNVFAFGAFQDWRARWELALTPRTRLHLAYFQRHYEAVNDGPRAEPWAYGGNGGWLWRTPLALVRFDVVGDAGFGGRRLGMDLTGRHRVAQAGVELEGRLTGTTWHALPAVGQAGTLAMAGFQLGAHYPIAPSVHLHGLVEDNVGPYDRRNVRALVILEVRATP
jgi:hypothetical protein